MRRILRRDVRILVLSALLAAAASYAAASQKFPPGPFFGQRPPGLAAERFAPGILSTADAEHGVPVFAYGRSEFYLTRVIGPPYTFENLRFRMSADGSWTREAVSFGHADFHAEIMVSRDGRRLYCCSMQPLPGAAREKNWNFWEMDLEGQGRDAVSRPLPPPLNSEAHDCQLFEAADGSFYFTSWRNGRPDLFRTVASGGSWVIDAGFGPGINSEADDKGAFVSENGGLLLFWSNREGGLGKDDIYLCRKGDDGRWGSPINAGPLVNSPSREWYPRLSPDGRFLFFLSDRTGGFDIYWIDAAVLGRSGRL